MAKKDKSNSSNSRSQANAPELRHMLHSQQPAHNPYYPDPASSSLLTSATSIPPPPYTPTSVSISATTATRNSVPMTHTNDISYPRIQSATNPIVIQAPGVPYDYRADRYRRKVRSFTSQTIVTAVFSIMLALWAYSLYNDRNCIYQFVVHKLNQDVGIKISDVRQAHLSIAYASGFLIILCLLKQAIGYRGKTHSCFLFIVGLFSLIMCIHNAYIAYLAYYSPCVATVGEIASNAFKTIVSKFADHLPAPDKGVFGETNVISEGRRDGNGLVIFIVDVLNLIFYLSIFVSSATLC